uniref:Uncharacterized protein n=1 Tax=Amphimedon queenslandica TaxID=400682 RepID=A0A1X7U053_AMPQE
MKRDDLKLVAESVVLVQISSTSEYVLMMRMLMYAPVTMCWCESLYNIYFKIVLLRQNGRTTQNLFEQLNKMTKAVDLTSLLASAWTDSIRKRSSGPVGSGRDSLKGLGDSINSVQLS